VDYIVADSFNINDDRTLNKLKNVNCIFFAGGDQNRLTKLLLNSRMLDSIKEIYNSGGVISGTSAGAAVMSKIMITGEELNNNDSSRAYNSIVSENIESAEGFGFIDDAIVDQHFIKRKRNNRLISLVLQHPQYLGIGIDESTAAIVYPDNTLEVLGNNQVIFYDASNSGMIKVDSLKNFSASDIKMHVLFSGQKFDMYSRSVIK
jgi:cyanophycinase